jgi:hypothetical protein
MKSWKISENIEVVDEAVNHHLSLIRNSGEIDCKYNLSEYTSTTIKYMILRIADDRASGVIKLRKLGAFHTELSLVIPKQITVEVGSSDDQINEIKKEITEGLDFTTEVIKFLISKMTEDGFSINSDGSSIYQKTNTLDHRVAFVNPQRFVELQKIHSDQFDLSKLLELCNEINKTYQTGSFFSVAMLLRAILDHVPPIFGFTTFEQVVGQYGNRSFKEHMAHLDKSLRKIADSYLHMPIRKKEVLPNQNQVDFSADLDVLLAEIVRILK